MSESSSRYLTQSLLQGQQTTDRIGTTDAGSEDQRFRILRDDLLSLTVLTVDGDVWTKVDSLLDSRPTDAHYLLQETPSGEWFVIFGDGSNGRIPAPSVSVDATYRYGASNSGNVGPLAVAVARSSAPRLGTPVSYTHLTLPTTPYV